MPYRFVKHAANHIARTSFKICWALIAGATYGYCAILVTSDGRVVCKVAANSETT